MFLLYYTECQGLVGVLVFNILSAKGWSVLLFILHTVSRVGLCSCVTYTGNQTLVFVLVVLHRVTRVGLCSCMIYTECQGLVFVVVCLVQ